MLSWKEALLGDENRAPQMADSKRVLRRVNEPQQVGRPPRGSLSIGEGNGVVRLEDRSGSTTSGYPRWKEGAGFRISMYL